MYLLLLTLAVQCYMPLVWKISAVKKYDTRVILLGNYIVTVIISVCFSLKHNLFSILKLLPQSSIASIMTEKTLPNTACILVVVGILAGLVYYLSLYYSQRNISVNGMGISSFFSQAGLVGSLIVAFFFFDEPISSSQALATVGIVFSILLMTSDKEKIKIRSPLLLAAVCICNVAVGVSNKFYSKYAIEAYKQAFLAIAFSVAFLSAGGKIALDIRRGGSGMRLGRMEIFFGATLGAANLLYTSLNLRCLQALPAVIVVPTLSAGGLILSTVLAIAVFKENTSRRHILAMMFSCICIFLLNL